MSSVPDPKDAEPERLRLFFAVWPEEESREYVQREIARWRRHVRANWVRPENLHLTLCFLGSVPRTRLDALCALNVVVPDPFEICFDALRFHRRRRMTWLAASRPNRELSGLVGGLEERLDELGQAHDRRPFRAHVTLARKVWGDFNPDDPPEPIRWWVRSFDLVASDLDRTGAHYRCLRRWPLRTTPTGSSVE